MEYESIVEVAETDMGGCNAYLKQGYKLLSHQITTRAVSNPEGKGYYVRRRIVYVMGRPTGTDRFDYQATRVKGEPRTPAHHAELSAVKALTP